MRLLIIPTLLFIVLMSFQCRTPAKLAQNDTVIEKSSIIIDETYGFMSDEPDYEIVKSEVKGDDLHLTVNYKGGCGKHDFKLMTNGQYLKSLPLQVMVYLIHTPENENCNKDVTKELVYNIASLRYRDHRQLILNMNGFTQKIEYKF